MTRRLIQYTIMLFTSLICIGCASMGGTRQLVAFDSPQRNEKVFATKGERREYLGTTPFTLELRRRKNYTLEIVAENGSKQNITVDCNYRWGSSGAGNLFFITAPPFPGAVYATALLIDYGTGAAWECPDHTQLPSPNIAPAAKPDTRIETQATTQVEAQTKKEDETENCLRYFIIPPPEPDDKVAEFMQDAWLEEQTKKDPNSCHRSVSFVDMRSFLGLYNLDIHDKPTIKSFSRTTLNYMNFSTSATHVVFLKEIESGDSIRLSGDVFDVFTTKHISTTQTEIARSRSRLLNLTAFSRFIARSTVFIPNSVAGAWSTNEIQIMRGNKKRVNAISGGGTSQFGFTMQSVRHPDPWRLWDASYLFSNSTAGRYSSLKDKDSPSSFDHFYFLTVWKVTGILDTPIGGFSMSLGTGPSYSAVREVGSPYSHGLAWRVGTEFAWSIFTSRNIYVQFFNLQYAAITSLHTSSDTRHETLTENGVMIGYFWPALRTHVRNWVY